MPSLPNEAAVARLGGAIPLERNDAWTVQRSRCMPRETISPDADHPIIRLPRMAD